MPQSDSKRGRPSAPHHGGFSLTTRLAALTRNLRGDAPLTPPRNAAKSTPIDWTTVGVNNAADWQKTGRELREEFRQRAGEPCNCYFCRKYQDTKRGRTENYWVDVVGFAFAGDPSSLVKHLRSRRELTPFDRRVLAELLEAAFTGEVDRTLRPTGRPKKHHARSCARFAKMFLQQWKESNRRDGINDWGHTDEMKDEACRVAIDLNRHFYIPRDQEVTFEEVRTLMDRPKSRR